MQDAMHGLADGMDGLSRCSPCKTTKDQGMINPERQVPEARVFGIGPVP